MKLTTDTITFDIPHEIGDRVTFTEPAVDRICHECGAHQVLSEETQRGTVTGLEYSDGKVRVKVEYGDFDVIYLLPTEAHIVPKETP